MLNKINFKMGKMNTKVILLLSGILAVSLLIGISMKREGFETSPESPAAKPSPSADLNVKAQEDTLGKMDEITKQKIIDEAKPQLDYLLPCLLKMDSCQNGLSMGSYGKAVSESDLVPNEKTLTPSSPSSD
jgi:hypothetical protein